MLRRQVMCKEFVPMISDFSFGRIVVEGQTCNSDIKSETFG
ncbi:hypothetical protein D1BOALGB6SA_2215 [Olavius sp. associated proteobacterium Delta 1]|nr:hypothetical protein D1BOALGB6SA_2215 [Olavius sp. associated proteobacterium Delta 1]